MPNNLKYFVSQAMHEKMVEMARQCITHRKIGEAVGLPHYIVTNRLKDVVITVEDRIASNLGDIQRAEKLLMSGEFGKYQISHLAKSDYRRYRSLLHYYVTADLNNGHVHLTKQLLKPI